MVMLTRLGGRTSMLAVVLGVGLALAVPPSYAGDGNPATCLGRAVTVAGTPGDDFRFASAGDVVALYGGDDTVLVGGTASGEPILVCGGSGFDQLFASGGANVLSGGSSPDYLGGGSGADVLKGGPGDDTLDASGDGSIGHVSDVVDGGPGNDECTVNPSDKVKNCETVNVVG